MNEQEKLDRGDIVEEPVVEEIAAPPEEKEVVDEPVDDGKTKDGDRRVPFERFQAVNDRYASTLEDKARLEGELRAYKEREKPPAPEVKEVDVRALRRAAKAAMLEGDLDKASALDDEADTEMERRADVKAFRAKAEAKAEAIAEMTAVSARESLAQVAEQMVQDYPFLNSNGPDSNPDAIAEVVEWRDFLIQKGTAPAAALRKAVERIAPIYAPKAEAGEDELTRKRRSLERAGSASKSQPQPLTSGQGARATASKGTDFAAMSEAEFRKIPAAELKRARGDDLA